MQDFFTDNGDFFAKRLEEEKIVQQFIKEFDAQEINEQGVKMVSDAQIKFFEKLLGEKDFGDKDTGELREAFQKLNQKSGSVWIEAAIALPKRDESTEEVTPAPFG